MLAEILNSFETRPLYMINAIKRAIQVHIESGIRDVLMMIASLSEDWNETLVLDLLDPVKQLAYEYTQRDSGSTIDELRENMNMLSTSIGSIRSELEVVLLEVREAGRTTEALKQSYNKTSNSMDEVHITIDEMRKTIDALTQRIAKIEEQELGGDINFVKSSESQQQNETSTQANNAIPIIRQQPAYVGWWQFVENSRFFRPVVRINSLPSDEVQEGTKKADELEAEGNNYFVVLS